MKKYLFLLLSIILILAAAPITATAQRFPSSEDYFGSNSNPINPFQGNLSQPVTEYGQLQNIAENVVRWIYTIFFILAVLFFLLAAYNYMRGGTLGEEYIKKAKSQLKFGIIAVAIALVASGVAVVINSFIGAAAH